MLVNIVRVASSLCLPLDSDLKRVETILSDDEGGRLVHESMESDGGTALHYAAYYNSHTIISYLVK